MRRRLGRGFHVYVESTLKSYFSFKKRHSMTNMGLVIYNKRFLYVAVGAPGSIHESTEFISV